MKIKSVIILKEEEMSAINKVIGMINFLTDGENLMISEQLKDDDCCRLDDVRETLITLREMCEVEEECPKMY